MKRVVLLLTVVTVLLGGALAAFAAVPPMINYQGKLLKPDGTSVADGTYSMRFAIYEDAATAEYLWMERNPAVQVKKGLFSVLLGSVNNLPANIFDSPNRFFGVTVGTDAEMAPRQQITTTAFAFKAAFADKATEASNGSPVGAMTAYAGAAAPTGWLLCDGRAVSRTEYAALFTAIGTAYGAGDGTSTFNLPNLQGRVPVGLSTEVEFNALGKAGGEKTHTLTVAEMPSHSHNVFTDSVISNTGKVQDVAAGNDQNTGWYYKETTPTGGDQPHNNLQPYVVVQWIVKM